MQLPYKYISNQMQQHDGDDKHYVCYKAHIAVTSYLYSALVRNDLEHCSTVRFQFMFYEMLTLVLFNEHLHAIYWIILI